MATADEYANWIVKNADKKGTPEFDIVAKAYTDSKSTPTKAPAEAPSKPFGQQLSEGIADIPRQVGLTARHGLKAVGNTVGLLSDPIGGVINKGLDAYDDMRSPTISELVTGKQRGSRMRPASVVAGSLADSMGLPKPMRSE